MIIFLYGEDTFRSRQILKELKNKFVREVDPLGSSLVVLEGEKISLDKINQNIGTTSLLSRKRMVVLENLFRQKDDGLFEKLLAYFKSQSAAVEENIIIIWDGIGSKDKGLTKNRGSLFRFLAGQKFSYKEFVPLSNVEVTDWARKQIEKRGAQITRDALATLVFLVGNDLWQLDQEIEKLVNYKAAQKLGLEAGVKIEVKEVQELVQGVFDEKIFALTDALSNRNKSLAVKLFEEQLDLGNGAEYLLNMSMRQFRILLQIRQALDSGLDSRRVTAALKLHPFVVQKSISQVRNFSLPALKIIYNRLIRIDYLMKSGKSDAKTELTLLISKL